MRILAQELRDAVLQAAIQGRLTTQNISSLTENNIKRHENFSQNMPFSIPQSWQWKKFSDLCIKISTGPFGTMLHKIDYETSGIPLINPIHMIRGNIVPSDNARVSRKKYKELSRYVLHSGDIVIARRGELGRTAIVTSKENGWLCGTGSFFVTPKNDVDNRYLRLFFLVPYVRVALLGNSIGTTMNNLNQSLLKSLPIPFPPLEEQRRIVERVNAIMAQIDEYEKIEQELVQLKADFPGDMRAAILQAAMQGKLTEQLESDSSVDEMLEDIKKEREILSKSDKYKIDKKFHPIDNAYTPFDIPHNWQFVSLRDIVYNRKQKIPDKKFSYIDIGSIDNEHHKLNNEENIMNADEAPSRARKIVESGDILYSTVRPYLHNMCIVDHEFSCEPIASTGFATLVCYKGVFNKYLLYYLMSPQFDKYANATDIARGVAYPAISDKRLYRAIVPLPPVEEQYRIVERLDELLPLCEDLA